MRGSPFTSLGLEWCPRCRQEVDTDTDAAWRHHVYTYRRVCGRCGRVLKYGAYATPLVGAERLMPAAYAWITQPGKDRR